MNNPTRRDPVYDPQQLDPLLIALQYAGDVDGMTALFEPDAVIDRGDGRLLRGRDAIRSHYVEVVASGRSSPRENTLICGPDFPTVTSPARCPAAR